MISVIVYGRNDSYGYNLAKRGAISLNCIAQVLDHENDEIIFVDCNTPNDIPTFPESIADTLTAKAKQLLRVIRVRPEQYERGRNGSKFSVLEPLCRNIAIRRSNPGNRWILHTNTDMVFTPLEKDISLSQIVSELQDGFYELPRFEMPESFWEGVDRMDPATVIDRFRYWGQRLHLDEVVTGSCENMYDAPGDFQLALRNQLFHIHGFNEYMIQGWHRDSNLCKRLWLLNGETRSLLHRLYGYHCDHTRIQSVYHMAGKSSENSLEEFVINVHSPFVPDQAESWGMPGEVFEEFRLDEYRGMRLQSALERVVPGMAQPIIGLTTTDSFDVGLHYDNAHVLPYIADILVNHAPDTNVGYFGANRDMLEMLASLRRQLGHTGNLIYCVDLPPAEVPVGCLQDCRERILASADSFIIDLSMKHLPWRYNASGCRIPDKCQEVVTFARQMAEIILVLAKYEATPADANKIHRPSIFVGCHNTSFDESIKRLFSCAITPANTYVRNGFVHPGTLNDPPPVFPFHFYTIGSSLEDVTAWISNHIGSQVSYQEVQMAKTLYSMFLEATDHRAFDALETLLSFGAGRGMLEMQLVILSVNGAPEKADAFRKIISDYESRRS